MIVRRGVLNDGRCWCEIDVELDAGRRWWTGTAAYLVRTQKCHETP